MSDLDTTQSRPRIAIIGAGFAGLGAAEALTRHRIPYDQFDRNPRLGGIWHAGPYPGVHLITPKRTTGYSHFPMPSKYPDYPSGVQVRDYLEAFAEQHGLLGALHLDTAVSAVTPVGDGEQWLVRFDSGVERLYDGVVAASGHHWVPRYPCVKGHFEGQQLHSIDYRGSEILRGRRVLVVGGGNSAADIAVAAACDGETAHISMRNNHWILPKTLCGRPTGEMLKGWMPQWLLRPFIRGLLAVAVGDYRRYGLQRPRYRLFAEDPTISTQLLYHLRHGSVIPHPGIRQLCGSRVEFTDGSSGEFDLVCWATGFHVSLPFLDESIVEVRNDNPQIIAGLFPPHHRNLYIFGVGHLLRPIPRYGVGPMIAASAEILALSILAQRRLQRPLGSLVAKLSPRPQAPFSVGPTQALMLAKLVGWLGAKLLYGAWVGPSR